MREMRGDIAHPPPLAQRRGDPLLGGEALEQIGQAGALADVSTVEAYCEWMKGLVGGPLPDGHYTLHAAAWDAANNTAIFSATFHATHTGDGGPVPPTNKKANADYVYALKMNGSGKVASMTKIWNDGHTLAELGWT